jgi:hypothetical protein
MSTWLSDGAKQFPRAVENVNLLSCTVRDGNPTRAKRAPALKHTLQPPALNRRDTQWGSNPWQSQRGGNERALVPLVGCGCVPTIVCVPYESHKHCLSKVVWVISIQGMRHGGKT